MSDSDDQETRDRLIKMVDDLIASPEPDKTDHTEQDGSPAVFRSRGTFGNITAPPVFVSQVLPQPYYFVKPPVPHWMNYFERPLARYCESDLPLLVYSDHAPPGPHFEMRNQPCHLSMAFPQPGHFALAPPFPEQLDYQSVARQPENLQVEAAASQEKYFGSSANQPSYRYPDFAVQPEKIEMSEPQDLRTEVDTHRQDRLEAAAPAEPQQHQPKGFQPTAMALRRRNGQSITQRLTPEEQEARRQAGISPAYRGNLSIPRNHSAQIPEDENCSIFITGLPGDCTVHTVLRALHGTGVGRVYFCHINRPQDDSNRPGRTTAAAKLVFFEAASASGFLQRHANEGFAVDGYHIQAVYNRNRVAEAPERKNVTRVLIISGPKEVVHEEVLEKLFRGHFEYQMDGPVITWGETETDRCLEWRFGSYRAQAQAACLFMRQNGIFSRVKVIYGQDPCA